MKQHKAFAALTILCLAILFLFQLAGTSLGLFSSDYRVNLYARDVYLPAPAVSAASGQITVVGDVPCAADAAAYLRRSYAQSALFTADPPQASVLLWQGNAPDEAQTARLSAFAQAGGTVVFCGLPDAQALSQSEPLRALLGVQKVLSPEVQTRATWLYDGFLLGGERIFDKLCPVVPSVSLRAGCVVYLSGFLGEPDDFAADRAPLLWRCRQGEGYVFTVNGDYLARRDGIGFLYAILAQTQKCFVCPVVNAQAMAALHAPILSDENSARMLRDYNQKSRSFFLNELLPDVTAVFSRRGYPFTCLFSGTMGDSADGEAYWSSLQSDVRQIVGFSGEMGLTGTSAASLERDALKLKELIRAYAVTLFAPEGIAQGDYMPLLAPGGALEDARTALLPLIQDNDMQSFAYLTDSVLAMPFTTEGFSCDQRAELMLRSVETALLYSCVRVNLGEVIYPPPDENRDWVALCKAWTDGAAAVMQPFDTLDKTSVSDADERARAFLNAGISVGWEGDTLTLTREGAGEGYFLLRCVNGKVTALDGAQAEKLEEGAYLLSFEAGAAQARFAWSPANTMED